MENQTADVAWKETGVPVSTRFDDPYFSLEDGLAETQHVFLQGNDLPGRFRDGFHVAELGFGTGLNFLATLAAWRKAGANGRLRFTSFEAFPMSCEDLSRALQSFEALGPVVQELTAQWTATGGFFDFADAQLEVIIGDARATLPRWQGQADAWYLDGFSPAKNPELWSPELMDEVSARTILGGTCATYTAAGFVRRGLSDAGFHVERVSGYGRKRHMSKGVKRA